MNILRKAAPVVALALLLGCGGTSSVSNASHLRFFNALSDTGNVRLYVGGHLYSAGSIGPSIDNGDDVAYGDVPSGTSESLVVNKYNNQTPGGNSASLATLTSQTLVEGLHYTAVALISGSTKKLVLFSDNSTLTAGNAYFRVIDGYSTTTPVFVELRKKSDNSLVYATSSTTGLAAGGSTGIQFFSTSDTDATDYTLTVYSDTGFTNPIGSATVSLTAGKSVTTFLYNNTSGTSLRFKNSTDAEAVTASSTATTGTTTTSTASTTS